MSRKIEVLKNITAELLNYLIVCSCAYIILDDFANVRPPVWAFVIMAIVPLFFYGLREWCEKLWLFLLLHSLPLFALILIYRGKVATRVIFIAIVILYLFLSIGKRVKSTGRGMEVALPPVVAGVYLALYLLDRVQGGGQNAALLLQLLICFSAGYFVFYYLRQFLSYMDINARTTENIPVKNVFYSSAGLAVGFTVISFLVITVCANRKMIERISDGIKSWIRRLLSLIRFRPEEITVEPEVWERQGGGGFPDLGEAVEPSLFMQIMDVVLTLAAFGLIFFFLVSGFIALKNLLKEGFGRKAYRQKFEETTFEDKIERIERSDESKNKRSSLVEVWRQGALPEEKIRRIYKKTMVKNIPSWEGEKIENLLQGATARECCMKVFSDDRECAMEFVGLYEKARYGKALCTRDDVGRMKELAKKL